MEFAIASICLVIVLIVLGSIQKDLKQIKKDILSIKNNTKG